MVTVNTAVSPVVVPPIGLLAQANLANKAKEKTSTDTPAVIVSLSDAAQQALAASNTDASKAVDDLLTSSGSALYTNAISSLKTYPVDLSTRYDELSKKVSLTPHEQAEGLALNKARNEREFQSFYHFSYEADSATTKAQSDHLLAQFERAYVEYYDSLSPQEQNSPRYRGTRDGAVAAYQAYETASSAPADPPPSDLSESQDPILLLFDKIKNAGFKLDAKGVAKILKDYKKTAGKLLSGQADPAGSAGKIQAASDRFTAVQSVLDLARKGDKQALTNLQNLAQNPTQLDGFLSYANGLNVTN